MAAGPREAGASCAKRAALLAVRNVPQVLAGWYIPQIFAGWYIPQVFAGSGRICSIMSSCRDPIIHLRLLLLQHPRSVEDPRSEADRTPASG
jgi:hypothetical protein